MAVLLSAVVLASVLGPEQIARYKDKATLNQIIVEESDSANEGYRYTFFAVKVPGASGASGE